MIPTPALVKKLLQYRIERTLNSNDEELLSIAFMHYSEKEIIAMVDEMEGTEPYPDDTLPSE